MTTPLAKLRELIKRGKHDAVLISSHSNIIYLTNYSGFSRQEREAYLFITADKQYILTDKRYSEAIKTLIPDFRLIEISPKNSVRKILKKLKIKHKVKKLGIEEDSLTLREYKDLTIHSNDTYHYSGIHSLRSIKTPEEVSTIEKACQLGDKVFNYVLKKIRLGISEKELANEIEFFIKRRGADISFAPIVAFGKNSAVPHHAPTANSKLLTTNPIILLDFGVKFNNYCSDMTRTVFFGSANAEFKKTYNTVLDAQSRAIELLNTKYLIHDAIRAATIDKVARSYIVSKGYKTIPHSLGHGVGIDAHEAPRLSPKSKDILKEGMVFSIEPGIYLSEFGGVRIEDLVVLEKGKARALTRSPKTLIEL